jgi:predicted XRE-type DNA-binding protein
MGDDDGSIERNREYDGNRAPTPLEVKQWLDKTGRTQSSFAQELGIGPPAISLWMTGKNSKRKQQATTLAILGHMKRDNNLPAGCTVPASADNVPLGHHSSAGPPRVAERAPPVTARAVGGAMGVGKRPLSVTLTLT